MVSSQLKSVGLEALPAFSFGNAQDESAGTGCTVIAALEGAVGGVDVRGGGPATRETDLLKPENMVQKVNAVVLSGGSAFGLAAATGVMEGLEARGIGFKVGPACVPIVVGADLFDLLIGSGTVRPDAAMGARALEAALAGEPFLQGNYGAGTGATVGKMSLAAGMPMKAGLGHAAVQLGSLVVGAVVAVNAAGCVTDGAGTTLAGVRAPDGTVLSGVDAFLAEKAVQMANAPDAPWEADGVVTNTTIGCVVTNAVLTKAQATKVASVTHDAYARTIYPVHTQGDGDAIFCLASGPVKAEQDLVSVMAVEAMQQAVVNAVVHAKSAYGLVGLAG